MFTAASSLLSIPVDLAVKKSCTLPALVAKLEVNLVVSSVIEPVVLTEIPNCDRLLKLPLAEPDPNKVFCKVFMSVRVMESLVRAPEVVELVPSSAVVVETLVRLLTEVTKAL